MKERNNDYHLSTGPDVESPFVTELGLKMDQTIKVDNGYEISESPRILDFKKEMSLGKTMPMRRLTTINKVSFGIKEATETLSATGESNASLPKRAQIGHTKKNLIGLITNINDTLGIKGPVKLDGDSDEGAATGKQQLDQGNAARALDNPDVSKCARRQNFMNKNHDLLTEAIQQYKEETELADDPEEILSVPEFII